MDTIVIEIKMMSANNDATKKVVIVNGSEVTVRFIEMFIEHQKDMGMIIEETDWEANESLSQST